MQSTRSRFRCPRCGEALTPWLRALDLADAVCLQLCHTWLLPAGYFLQRESALLRGSYLASPPAFPWLFAPMTSWWLRVHPDRIRTSGCCGMNFVPGAPNLVCACGHEVGIGYKDCLGPYWYSLHESVVREDAADETPPRAIEERLARARERVEAPIPTTAYDPGKGSAGLFVETWHEARNLSDVEVDYGGGIDAPALVITSPQLPVGATLIVPIPWCQLVRFLVLGEQPWGEVALPLSWKGDGLEEQQVQLTRRKRRLLLTVWGPGQASWAVTISPKAWAAEWARLRD